jgi:hypothetical protein
MYKEMPSFAFDLMKGQAWVRTINYQTPFRARLTLHFWSSTTHDPGTLVGECNEYLPASPSVGYTLVEVQCAAPANTVEADLSVRANNGCSGCSDNGAGYGTVVVDRIKMTDL